LLRFDHDVACWSWDLGRIHAKGYTANVVDLMVGKLTRLRVQTQQAVKQFACLGNIGDARTLSIVFGKPEEEVQADLWEAIHQELIVTLKQQTPTRSAAAELSDTPSTHSSVPGALASGGRRTTFPLVYKFVHDHIQEAAYSLIQEELRAETHLRIGRLLWAQTTPEKTEEFIFEIVNQLNRGAALITSGDERERLAQLNLIAGKRAKASSAYLSALNYLTAGATLLSEDCWDRKYDLIFPLELHRAECEFLTGDLAAAEERLSTLSRRAANLVDQAAVTCLRIDLYAMLVQGDRAVAVCLEYLRRVGVDWSPHPTDEDVRQEYERIWQRVGSRPIEELVDLPLMNDAGTRATMDVLTKLRMPALMTDEKLLCLMITRMVNLSLEYGNSNASCAGTGIRAHDCAARVVS
jgi:predicted ATPase